MSVKRRYSPLELRIIEHVLDPRHEPFLGDLETLYRYRVSTSGPGRAHLWLIAQLVYALPRIFLLDLSNANDMLSNYLKVALRQIARYRLFSAVNILGLAVSLTVCLLILNLIQDQRSFDQFHPDADRIYRITTAATEPFGRIEMATSAAPLGPELELQIPDIEQLVQLRRSRSRLQSSVPSAALYSGLYAGAGFFEMFGFKLLRGNPDTALQEPRSIVLSDKLAKQLFPDGDAIGEVLVRDDSLEFAVTGILGPPRGKTHMSVDALLSFSTLQIMKSKGATLYLNDWNVSSQYYNYVRLAPGADTDRLVRVADELVKASKSADGSSVSHRVQRMDDINLGRELSNQIGNVLDASFARILSILAILLVISAVFNYVNLTMSRSIKRAREIGIRKVVGAHRTQIGRQLILESALVSLCALAIAVAVQFWLVPQFNSLSFVTSDTDGMALTASNPVVLMWSAAFTILVGVLAGVIPAIRISRFSPVRIIRGMSRAPGPKHLTLKRSLLVVQFIISIVVITVTILIYRQSAYVASAEYGFDEDQVVHVTLNGADYNLVSKRFSSIPGVEEVSATSSVPAGPSSTFTDIRTSDMAESRMIMKYSGDVNFLTQYRIKLLAGRNLSAARDSDDRASVILSKSAIRMLGFDTAKAAVGQQVIYDTWTLDRPATIVGVMDDFYARGFDDGLTPSSLVFRPNNYRFASVRINPKRTSTVLAELDDAWAGIASGLPIQYSFFDDDIRARYEEWRDIRKMLFTFAIMIVIIASLGLLGMATFSAESRIREVGIRKALGADSSQVLLLLSREFMLLVAIAVLIAAPVSTILGGKLLARSANHVEFGLLTILGGAIPVIFISLLTIGSQTLRAARMNPVDVIRSE